MSWACFHAPIYVLRRMCILPFVVRIPIPPRPTIDNNINYDSQLFMFPFLIMSRAMRVAQSVARLTQEPKVSGPIPGLATYFRFSFR